MTVSPDSPQSQAITHAADVLRAGGLVAFPTETVYGLGASALDERAVAGIFAAKERPSTDPLIVHLAALDDLPTVAVHIPPLARTLASAFWPGPLTLVLPRAVAVPPAVSAGRDTVAVRIPAHPVALALIQATGIPIAAPSANRFGHTSPTTAAHVLADLEGRIDMVLDGGPTPIGLESTVLDLTTPVPTVLRPGGVSREALAAVVGAVVLSRQSPAPDAQQGLASPGMLERHYAPTADLWLCIGAAAAAQQWLINQAQTLVAAGQKVGLLLCDEDIAYVAPACAHHTSGVLIEPLGSERQLEQVARRLYAALRALDARHPDVILVREFGDAGLALAIRDRLTRAASGRVVRL
jgi:L-threonylcarbamoyladenylate synthase